MYSLDINQKYIFFKVLLLLSLFTGWQFVALLCTQVLKAKLLVTIKTMCPNYILEFRNTKSHLLNIYRTWVKIEIVIENHVC